MTLLKEQVINYLKMMSPIRFAITGIVVMFAMYLFEPDGNVIIPFSFFVWSLFYVGFHYLKDYKIQDQTD